MSCSNRAYILGGLMAFFMAVPVSAAVFDFTPENLSVEGSQSYVSVGMIVDNIGVDVTAYTIVNDGSGVIFSSSQIVGDDLEDGLGDDVGVHVSSTGTLGALSDIGEVLSMDGGEQGNASDIDEGLLFSFNKMVSLDFVDFISFSVSEDFNLTVDGVTVFTNFGADSSSLLASQSASIPSAYDFSNVTGQNFLFWADENKDSFRIKAMHVSAVPEPAPLLLFGLGLAILGFVRRNRIAK